MKDTKELTLTNSESQLIKMFIIGIQGYQYEKDSFGAKTLLFLILRMYIMHSKLLKYTTNC